MKTLLKVSKLIPKLGTDNAHEKMATLLMIEKLLASEAISWTDVGQQVGEFLTSVLGVVEEEALPPPAPAPAWTSVQPTAAPVRTHSTAGWSASPTPRPAASPPPRPAPRGPDPRCHGGVSARKSLVAEIILKKCWISQAENQVIQALSVQLNMNLPISRKQIRVLETVSTRL